MVKNQPGDGETGKSQGLSTTWRRGVVLFSASALLLLMFSIDKLAVATQYSKSEFAEYAFAAGVLGIVYLALDALAYAINPFIGGELEMGSGDAHKLRWLFVGLIWFAPAIYWPAARAIAVVYPQYDGSLLTLRALMTSIPLVVVFRAWVIPAVRAAGLEVRLLILSACAVAAMGGAIAVAVHLGAASSAVAWVWSMVAALLGLGSLLFIGPLVQHLAGPSRMTLMVNAVAACASFLLVSRNLSWAAMCVFALVGAAMVASTRRLTPAAIGAPR